MQLTEEQIERRVERMVDHLDRIYFAGQITEDNYNKSMRELRDWADIQSRKAEIWARVQRRS